MASESDDVMQVSSGGNSADGDQPMGANARLSQGDIVQVDSSEDVMSGEDFSESEGSEGSESDDEDSGDSNDDVSDDGASEEDTSSTDGELGDSSDDKGEPFTEAAATGASTTDLTAENDCTVVDSGAFKPVTDVSKSDEIDSTEMTTGSLATLTSSIEKNMESKTSAVSESQADEDKSLELLSKEETDEIKGNEEGKSDEQSDKKVKKPRKRRAKTKPDEDGKPEKTAKKKSKDEKEKRGRKRKRKEKKEKGEKKRKTTFERRNIRKIKEQSLDEETLRAQREEMERKKRLAEKIERLKASQLQTLLDDDSMSDEDVPLPPPKPAIKPKKKDDVVEISSDEDEGHVAESREAPDVTEEEPDDTDPDNSGSHVNDAMNQPDDQGRVLVNVGHPPKEPDIFLAPQLGANVKPHQIGGIRFLYDNLVESLEQYKTSNGLGCILAHSMGLGKTLQVISFVDCFLRYTSGKRVLIIVPVNTLQNWMSEFNMWLPDKATLIGHYKRHREAQRLAEAELAKQEADDLKLEPEMEQPDSTTDLKSLIENSSDFQAEPEQNSDFKPRIDQETSFSVGSQQNGDFKPVMPQNSDLQAELKSEIEHMTDITFDSTLDFGNVDTAQASNSNFGAFDTGSSSAANFAAFSSNTVNSSNFHRFPPNSANSGNFGAFPNSATSDEFVPMEDIKLENIVPQLDGQSDPKPDQVSSSTHPPIAENPQSIESGPNSTANTSAVSGVCKNNPHSEDLKQADYSIPKPESTITQSASNSGEQKMSDFLDAKPSSNDISHKDDQSKGSFKNDLENLKQEMGSMKPKFDLADCFSMKDENSSSSFKLESEDSKQSTDSCFKKPKDEILKSDSKLDAGEEVPESVFSDVWPREFPVYLVNDTYKTNAARAKTVGKWYKEGGVLLMGYEMYRLLTSKRVCNKPKKTKKELAKEKEKDSSEPVTIDLVEEEKNTELMSGLNEALINPGPDLVICDEGHRIKNSHASISQSLKNIKTRRRVVLTGYPLQNNLLEYWCMVDFVRPNFLGTKTEFCNMFERPIMNGQCSDSTPQDVRLMRFRAHVLHSLLEGFVQRRSAAVLRNALPPKEESVLLVKMSPVQRRLYKAFMDMMGDVTIAAWANANPLKAFSVCCKIWNHPDILHQIIEQRKMEDNDLDIEDKDEVGGQAKGKKGRGLKKSSSMSSTTSMDSLFGKESDHAITYDWAEEIMRDYEPGLIENGGKMLILFSIVQQSIALGDKILVFSQSLFTLSLIEKFLSKMNVPWPENNEEKWAKNKNYYRLDGSTTASEREKLINFFNSEANDKVHLFLLSTRAGCLGINLIGANRVVIFDASWNPCHDCQAVCRVYRYGQSRPCYVYRLVTDNTMEKKIYDRQVNKQGVSDRVVDELNPNSIMTRKQVDVLLEYEDIDLPEISPETAETYPGDDVVLYNVLSEDYKWITKVPFNHEALLADNKEQKLTKTEKKLARQGYEMEKKLSISYSRPSYQAFYPKAPGAGPLDIPRLPMFKHRPVASVRPMIIGRPSPLISTPIPMQAMGGRTQYQRHAPTVTSSSGGPALLKPGVSVQQIKLTTDIPIPGATQGITKIPAGETVLVIRTPKGVYIRTPQGKIFAVRSTPKGTDMGTGAATGGEPADDAANKPAAETSGAISASEGKEGDSEKDISTQAVSKPGMTITVTNRSQLPNADPTKSPKPVPRIIVQPKASAVGANMPKGTVVNIVPRVTRVMSGSSPSVIQLRPSIGSKTQSSLFPRQVVNASRQQGPAQKPKTVIIQRKDPATGRIIITRPDDKPATPPNTPSKKSDKEIVAEMLQKLEKGKKEDAMKAKKEEAARKQREEKEKQQRELLLEMEKDPNRPALSPADSDTSDSVEEWMEDQLHKMRQLARKHAAANSNLDLDSDSFDSDEEFDKMFAAQTNASSVTSQPSKDLTPSSSSESRSAFSGKNLPIPSQAKSPVRKPVETAFSNNQNNESTPVSLQKSHQMPTDSQLTSRVDPTAVPKPKSSFKPQVTSTPATVGVSPMAQPMAKATKPPLSFNPVSQTNPNTQANAAVPIPTTIYPGVAPVAQPSSISQTKPPMSAPNALGANSSSQSQAASISNQPKPPYPMNSQHNRFQAPFFPFGNKDAPTSPPVVGEKKKRAPKAPKDPNAPPKERKKREPRDPNAPRKKPGPKPKNTVTDGNMPASVAGIPQPQNVPHQATAVNADTPAANVQGTGTDTQSIPLSNEGIPSAGLAAGPGVDTNSPSAEKKKRAPRKPKDPNAPRKKPGPKPKNPLVDLNSPQNQHLSGMAPGSVPNMDAQLSQTGMTFPSINQYNTEDNSHVKNSENRTAPLQNIGPTPVHPAQSVHMDPLPAGQVSGIAPQGSLPPTGEKKKRAPRKPRDPNAPRKKPGPKPKDQTVDPINFIQNQNTAASDMSNPVPDVNMTNMNNQTLSPNSFSLQPASQNQTGAPPNFEPTAPEKKKRAPRKPKDPNTPPKPRKSQKKQEEPDAGSIDPQGGAQGSLQANQPSQMQNIQHSSTAGMPQTPMYQPWTNQSTASADNPSGVYQPWDQSYGVGSNQGLYQPWNNKPNTGNLPNQGGVYQPWKTVTQNSQSNQNEPITAFMGQAGSKSSAVMNSVASNNAMDSSTAQRRKSQDDGAVISIEDLTGDDSLDKSLDNSDFLSSDSSEMLEFINESVKKYGHMYENTGGNIVPNLSSQQPTASRVSEGVPGLSTGYQQSHGAPDPNQYAWGMMNQVPGYPQSYGAMGGYQNPTGYGSYSQPAQYGWPPVPGGAPPITQSLGSSNMFHQNVKAEPNTGSTTGAAPPHSQGYSGWPSQTMCSQYGMPANPYYMNPGAPQSYPSGQQQNYYGS